MKKSEQLRLRLAQPNNPGIWWTPSMNRLHDQTGVSHIVHGGGCLCGARPYSSGGSFRTALEVGTHECRRCRAILDEAMK